jgi:hypothetical protein
MTDNLNGSQKFLLPDHQWLKVKEGVRPTMKDLPLKSDVEKVFIEWMQEHSSTT